LLRHRSSQRVSLAVLQRDDRYLMLAVHETDAQVFSSTLAI
jgi:hypothetical protein